jgi:hypothetical protein
MRRRLDRGGPLSPRVRGMNQKLQPQIILVLRRVQSLCVSSGPESLPGRAS